VSKTAHQLYALKQHLYPGLPQYSKDDLITLAMFFASSPRKVRIHSASSTVQIVDHPQQIRLSMARWLAMTIQWQRKDMGKLTFDSPVKDDNGAVRLYRPVVRIAFKPGGPKYRTLLHKWILASMYPKAHRRVFFIDGDRSNCMEANLMPKPYGSFFPGLEETTVVFPEHQQEWTALTVEGGEYSCGDELSLYEEMAENGASLEHPNPGVNATGTEVIDPRKELHYLEARAKALDAFWGTHWGVRGWFTKNGRKENNLKEL